MAPPLLLLLLLTPSLAAAAAAAAADAPSCSSYSFATGESFASCSDLPHLNASLHWTYARRPGTLRVAFRAPGAPDGWVAWGINPAGAVMAGTQAVVAFRHSNGSMVCYPAPLDGHAPAMVPAEIGFPAYSLAADYAEGEMIIFATLGVWNGSDVHHLWQVGKKVVGDVPKRHEILPENLKSVGRISFT